MTSMRPIEELVAADSAFPQVREWIANASNRCALLEPPANRADALYRTQVTTRSSMGAIVFETGGVLIENGWLRLLGSGNPRLSRSLPTWNEGKAEGLYFIADDAAGGFFALNGGALGDDTGNVYYWPPDSLEWERLQLGYSQFLQWCLGADLSRFYAGCRWSTWQQDVQSLPADQCVTFYPPLWSREGSPDGSHRGAVPMQEAYDFKLQCAQQLGRGHYTR